MTGSQAGPASEILAALDVGSNSIRLSVAEYDPDRGLHIIDEVKDQPRLAAGLTSTGALDPEAMQRAIDTLTRMRGIADRRGVTRLRAVATAAVREASNGRAFVKRVKKEVGLDLEVIDEDTEATVSYRSVAHHFTLQNTRSLVVDIGGGSLELVGSIDGLIEMSASLPMGAVRLTETFLTGKHSRLREIGALRRWARRRLKKTCPRKEWRGALTIGSGGTFTNLARIARARRGDDDAMVHGEVVTTGKVEQLLEWLATKSAAERAAVPGLNPKRADIILAGLAVTAELLDVVEAPSVTVSAYGLREGILLEMVGGSAPITADPYRAMREFVERCHGDLRHVEQVRKLALTLFDRLQHHLGAADAERHLLESAGLLHDVGQVVSYRRHHKHSYQLIMHADRLNLTAGERELVALISRYHRRKGPRLRHPEFAGLNKADRKIVRRLAGLLRLADGLDRGHGAAVESLTTRLTKEALYVRIAPRDRRADLSLEIWGALRKSDVLEKVLDRRVHVAVASR